MGRPLPDCDLNLPIDASPMRKLLQGLHLSVAGQAHELRNRVLVVFHEVQQTRNYTQQGKHANFDHVSFPIKMMTVPDNYMFVS